MISVILLMANKNCEINKMYKFYLSLYLNKVKCNMKINNNIINNKDKKMLPILKQFYAKIFQLWEFVNIQVCVILRMEKMISKDQ